ncbi:UspA domain-containing protein [Haloterrigena salina JCM 13891]|uniref:UspA domain-containing protein n=1 Tax=Haloterrigena salina JCM 13891 TaxID=1227488 RepID=M0C5T9_9EURY|nr:universal stress protein [Haloterrigena salina]ELZ18560.1 UspA domain-containing protein [Haloterrigena salina JCM 13891]
MYRVLLPVDEHESRARAQAEAVGGLPAAAVEIRVDVLHVHEEVTAPDAEWAAGGFSDEYAEEMADNLRNVQRLPDSVETAADVLESAGVEYAIHETTGEAPEMILEAAAELDSDAIVLGVGERSPVGKVLFGSVVQAVILESDRPVTVVSAGEEGNGETG